MVIQKLQFFVLYLQIFFEAFGKFFLVHQIADADTDAIVAIHIAGADTALGRTDFILATGFIADTIHKTMVRQYHMRTVGNADAGQVDAAFSEAVHFFEHNHRVKRHAIAHNAVRTLEQNSGGHQTQLICLAVYDYRMTGIAAALKTDYRIGLLSQIIHDFALTFVTPLGTCYYYC